MSESSSLCPWGIVYDPLDSRCREAPLVGVDGKPNGLSRCPRLTVCAAGRLFPDSYGCRDVAEEAKR